MKLKFSLIYAAILAGFSCGFSGCKSPEEKAKETTIKFLKESLDDPDSFEFITWGSDLARVTLHDTMPVRRLMDRCIKRNDLYVSRGYGNFDANYDTIKACIFLKHVDLDMHINVDDEHRETLKDCDFGLYASNLCDSYGAQKVMESYLDTARLDTIKHLELLNYRCKNKYGAVVKKDTALDWEKFLKD